MRPTAAEGSVKNLQELYTVAVGVALVKAMEVFLGHSGVHEVDRWANWPALVAFVATIVPFYHGAMRHLDKVYVEDRGRHVRRGALLADFLMLFIEAGILLGMAIQLGNMRDFAWWLVLLLAFDSVWGVLVHLLLTTRARAWTEFKWALINVPTAILLAVVLTSASGLATLPVGGGIAIGIMVIAMLRSTADYAWSWSFYLPNEGEGSEQH